MIETINSKTVRRIISERDGDAGTVITNPDTLITEGTVEKMNVTDGNNQTLLGYILKELRIMNLHLSLMTDEYLNAEEII